MEILQPRWNRSGGVSMMIVDPEVSPEPSPYSTKPDSGDEAAEAIWQMVKDRTDIAPYVPPIAALVREALQTWELELSQARSAIAGTADPVKLAEYADKAAHAQAILDGTASAALMAEAMAEAERLQMPGTAEIGALWIEMAEGLRAARTRVNVMAPAHAARIAAAEDVDGIEAALAIARADLAAFLAESTGQADPELVDDPETPPAEPVPDPDEESPMAPDQDEPDMPDEGDDAPAETPAEPEADPPAEPEEPQPDPEETPAEPEEPQAEPDAAETPAEPEADPPAEPEEPQPDPEEPQAEPGPEETPAEPEEPDSEEVPAEPVDEAPEDPEAPTDPEPVDPETAPQDDPAAPETTEEPAPDAPADDTTPAEPESTEESNNA